MPTAVERFVYSDCRFVSDPCIVVSCELSEIAELAICALTELKP